MNMDELRNYCLSFEGAWCKMPFRNLGDRNSSEILCFYVGRKWFCFVNASLFDYCCLKALPEESEMLRSSYAGIRPAWHMNKRMWNDVYFDTDVPDEKIKELLRRSYELVFSSLSKREKSMIEKGI